MNNDGYNKVNKQAQSGYGSSQRLYGSLLPGLGAGVDDANEFNTGLRNTIAGMYMNGGGNSRPKTMEGWSALPPSAHSNKIGSDLYYMAGGGDIPFAQPSIDMWQKWRDTGGLSIDEQSNMRRAATNVIPSIYSGMKSNMDRMRSVQGGYSGGYNAQTAALTRDASREAQRASENAEGEIARMQFQGKQFGTQGLENFFARYGDTYNQNRRFGISGLMDLDRSERDAMMSQTNRDEDASMQRAGGLLGLYGTAPAGTNSAWGNLFQGLSGRDSSGLGYLSLLAGLNPKKSLLDTIFKGAGAGAGLISAFSH